MAEDALAANSSQGRRRLDGHVKPPLEERKECHPDDYGNAASVDDASKAAPASIASPPTAVRAAPSSENDDDPELASKSSVTMDDSVPSTPIVASDPAIATAWGARSLSPPPKSAERFSSLEEVSSLDEDSRQGGSFESS